jgi:NTE family protein
VATDLDSGAPILFQRGDTGLAVRASSAVPAVFQPVRIGAREYVDGGLVSPVPVRFARQMGAETGAGGGHLHAARTVPPRATSSRMLLQTFSHHGAQHQPVRTARRRRGACARRLQGVGSADFASRGRALAVGREAARAALSDLRARIAALTR